MKNRKTSINHICMLDADVLQNAAMVQLKGGTTNVKDSEWELIYIDGKPVWVRRNSAGQIIEMQSF